MGKILQNCSLSLQLNFIFEITNEIGLYHKFCFFCSNGIIKSLFFRLDQPACMHSPEGASQSATRTSNGSCSEVLTLSIGSFIQKAELPAIEHCIFPIQNYTSDVSLVYITQL